MNIYNIPIKCTPQLVCLPMRSEVVDVTEPQKVGQLFLPTLLVKTRSGPCPPEDIMFLTVHSVCVNRDSNQQGSCEDYREQGTTSGRNSFRELISLVEHCNMPVNDQEQRMVLSGTFTHYYSKDKYYVYVESLTQNNYGGITLTPSSSNSTRAIDEGSLTRTFV